MSVNKKLRDKATNRFPPIVGQAAAPIIFMDGFLGFGAVGGTVQVEIGSSVLIVKPDDSTELQIACVAHLRMTPRVALNMVKVLNDALTLHRDNVMKQRQAQQSRKQRKPVPVAPAEEDEEEAEAEAA